MIDYADLEQRLRTRLDPVDAPADGPTRGDGDLMPNWMPPADELRPAAVLAAIVRRPKGWTMLFTQRTHDTPAHPGQISFPGGRVQAGDGGALQTALRETEEEIGLTRRCIEPLGAWNRYSTGTGFCITPIVGFVEPGFAMTLDPREVAEVFETPVAFLLNPANHVRHEIDWQGARRQFYGMTYEHRFIWGATAGMIRALWERLYA